MVEFNVPLDTVQVISETTTLSSDEHLPFSNGGEGQRHSNPLNHTLLLFTTAQKGWN